MRTALEKPRLNSLPAAAESLGVSIKTLRGWIYRRQIDFVKIGRSVRISDETINRLIERGTRPALEKK